MPSWTPRAMRGSNTTGPVSKVRWHHVVCFRFLSCCPRLGTAEISNTHAGANPSLAGRRGVATPHRPAAGDQAACDDDRHLMRKRSWPGADPCCGVQISRAPQRLPVPDLHFIPATSISATDIARRPPRFAGIRPTRPILYRTESARSPISLPTIRPVQTDGNRPKIAHAASHGGQFAPVRAFFPFWHSDRSVPAIPPVRGRHYLRKTPFATIPTPNFAVAGSPADPGSTN